jgi:hypothetical protein
MALLPCLFDRPVFSIETVSREGEDCSLVKQVCWYSVTGWTQGAPSPLEEDAGEKDVFRSRQGCCNWSGVTFLAGMEWELS